jgi:biotin carboxyl carrier protein
MAGSSTNRRHFIIMAVLIVLSTIVMTWLLRVMLPLPMKASTQAATVDYVFNWNMFLIALFFSLVMVIMLYAVVVFRRRGDDDSEGEHFEGNSLLEIVWTVVPLIVVIFLAILGVTTNKSFLVQLLKDQRFVDGEATTGLIDENVLNAAKEASKISEATLALSAVLLLVLRSNREHNPWTWGQTAGYEKFLTLVSGEATQNVSVKSSGADFTVRHGENETSIELLSVGEGAVAFVSGGVRRSAKYALQENTLYLDDQGFVFEIEDVSYRPALSDDEAGSGQIVASTEGLVIGVAVSEGERVEKGQLLVTIEAMKMEHRLVADGDGVVTTVSAQLNAQVKKGHMMIELDLDESGGDQ